MVVPIAAAAAARAAAGAAGRIAGTAVRGSSMRAANGRFIPRGSQQATAAAATAGATTAANAATSVRAASAARSALEALKTNKLATAVGGYMTYQGVAGIVGSGMHASQAAVGHAIKRADFQYLMAQTGFGYSMERWQAAAVVQTMAGASTGYVVGEDMADATKELVDRNRFTVMLRGMSANDRARHVSEWDRYGYMINESFKPQTLSVMSSYSFWQTEDAVFTTRLPHEAASVLSEAFNRGVTVWTRVADIGNDVANTPLPTAQLY